MDMGKVVKLFMLLNAILYLVGHLVERFGRSFNQPINIIEQYRSLYIPIVNTVYYIIVIDPRSIEIIKEILLSNN